MSSSEMGQRSRSEHAAQSPPPDTHLPADRYQELFVAVQRESVFEDSKTFVDCAPIGKPAEILAAYRAPMQNCRIRSARLRAPELYSPEPRCQALQISARPTDRRTHRWPLGRAHPSSCTAPARRLAATAAAPVCGAGRTLRRNVLLGFLLHHAGSGRWRACDAAACDDRQFCLSDRHLRARAQWHKDVLPEPFPASRFSCLMTELCEASQGQSAMQYLPQLVREHAFWMDGAAHLLPGRAHRRVVALQDGTLLNRYWDDRDTPREESWREDVNPPRVQAVPLPRFIATSELQPSQDGTSVRAGSIRNRRPQTETWHCPPFGPPASCR